MNQIAKLYDSARAICDETIQQTVPDDSEKRGMCYNCYLEMWGKLNEESRVCS
jgi:hypothetical protein